MQVGQGIDAQLLLKLAPEMGGAHVAKIRQVLLGEPVHVVPVHIFQFLIFVLKKDSFLSQALM